MKTRERNPLKIEGKDDPEFTLFNRITIAIIFFASLVIASALGILIVQNRRTIKEIMIAIDTLPVWVNTCIVLFLLCVVSVSWVIIRSYRKQWKP